MWDRRQLLWRWWLVVLVGFGALTILTLVNLSDGPGPSVVRVVGDDADLWALTQERSLMQGVETAWWVSHDGGATWSAGQPPHGVAEAGPREETCSATACYRLVDGRKVERQAVEDAAWRREHERPLASAPPAINEHRRDWDEERSIAAAEGPGLDAAAVAAGKDGALVRATDGGWYPVSVGRPWEYRIRWWLIGIGGTVVLLGGLVVDQTIRQFRPAPVDSHPWPPRPPEVPPDEHLPPRPTST